MFFSGPVSVFAADFSQEPVTTGVSVIMIDADSGQVLFEKNADEIREPASLTKVMTALVFLESGIPLDTVVTIDQEAQDVNDTQINIAVGEQITAGDLLAATMLHSANDAAMGLAKAVCPDSSADFYAKMNAKAEALGMTSSHFGSPNGLHTAGHVSTARDMATLTREAMKNETFRSFVSLATYDIPATNMHEPREIRNRNLLVRDGGGTIMVYGERRPVYYEGALGVKTGYTGEAGNCLIGAATRGDLTVITVVMGSPPPGHQYEDTVSMFEYAFANYHKTDVFPPDKVGRDVAVVNGTEESVRVVPSATLVMDLRTDQLENLEYEYTLPESMDAPVAEGAEVGSVRAVVGGGEGDGVVIGESPMVVASDVGEPPTIFSILSFGHPRVELALKIVCAVVLAVVVLFVGLVVRKRIITRRRNRRRRGRGRRSDAV
jgi:D-alanyl-D-alanine carboxypeptidase (penicillin-binding protein 5/6)